MIICSWREQSVIGVTNCPDCCSILLHGAGRPRISCKFIKMSCLPCASRVWGRGTEQRATDSGCLLRLPACAHPVFVREAIALHACLFFYESVPHPLGVCPDRTVRVSSCPSIVSVFVSGSLCVCASTSLHVWKSLCVVWPAEPPNPWPSTLSYVCTCVNVGGGRKPLDCKHLTPTFLSLHPLC